MKFSKRITAITELCPALESWADIGADHGHTSASLIFNGKAKKVFATDISKDSLKKAELLRKELGLCDSIALRVGDGFYAVISDATEGAVISGMGAPLIIKIIEANKEYAESLKYMVLSPNNYSERLREYLNENSFEIEKELMVEEREKYYPVMLVKRGSKKNYSEKQLYLGINTVINDDLIKFLKHKRAVWEDIKKDTSGSNAHALKMYDLYNEALISLHP